MRLRQVARRLSRFAAGESGMVFLEALVALAILGVLTITFLGGLTTTSMAVMISQERVVAEDLSKSQLEYIRAQDYILTADYDPNDPAKRYGLIDISADLVAGGYAIDINPPQTIISPGVEGFELQSITVVIRRNGEEMLAMSGYKAGRAT